MTLDTETAKAAGIDPEQVQKAVDLLHQLKQGGEEGQETRRAFIRALSELARENGTARAMLENMLELDSVKRETTPEILDTFWAYYLEGDKRPSPRSLGRRFYIDTRTIHRRNRKAIDALLVPFFGVDGVNLRG